MHIIIDNKVAAIKAGSSFEYVSENRLFGGGDDYTFAITLPLAGCTVNQRIFGHINRADVVAGRIRFDCEIRCANFTKFGTATITEITEQNVKLQFLAGRSEQNFDNTWDKVYINELTLGSPEISSASNIDPLDAWDPEKQGMRAVALPWFNNDSRIIHNCAEYAQGKYSWSPDTKYLSWMPYLLWLTKKICEALPDGGYQYDFSAWEANESFKYLLVCNTLPDAWNLEDFARALPHWTVDEYFEKLELFLMGEFDIDHRAKFISFAFTDNLLQSRLPIKLEEVVDAFTTQINDKEQNCEYRESRNIVFKKNDMKMYKYYECDKLIDSWQGMFSSYETLDSLISDNRWLRTYVGFSGHRGNNRSALLYAKDVDVYFVIRAIDRRDNPDTASSSKWQYRCILQPVNLYGGRIVDKNNDDQLEIEFLPVPIDFTEDKYGYAVFLQPSGYSEKSSSSDGTSLDEIDDNFFDQPWIQGAWEAEREEGDTPEYYSEIFIAWWNGAIDEGGHLPYPRVENIHVNANWDSWQLYNFNFRLNDSKSSRGKRTHIIDPKTKTTFKFLSDTIPDVRAVFHIQGKRYICEKITATFTDGGMSRLMKGEFWPLVDD